jgi:hypothetical protein
MKRVLYSTFVIGLLSLGACKTYQIGSEVGKQIAVQPREYEIKGPVRVEGVVGKDEATFDGLLKAAREKYGPDVDVINVKVDRAERGKKTWLIMNGYAVRYVQK